MPLVKLAKQFDFDNHPHDLEWMMADTRLRQSEAALRLIAGARRGFLQLSGLATLGRMLGKHVITPLRVALMRRRTVAQLQQLDDRLLADIGIERATMVDVVCRLAALEISRKSTDRNADWPKAEAAAPVAVKTAPAAEMLQVVTSPRSRNAANSNKTTHRAA